ncbi:hypothetical protein C8R44DRAFT_752767 [Mycena epipterygia]|nr:hypothetical protein C8R44DRAFT_752767 [Mycena epipterygia]
MSSDLDNELLNLVGGTSLDKEEQNRKRIRSRDGSTISKPQSSKKRKVIASSSENDDQSEELYPLDNKYLNEADREMLLGKPEIEREEILAARLDEMERIRDQKHIRKILTDRGKSRDDIKETRGDLSNHSHKGASSPVMSDSESEDGQISKPDLEDERVFGIPKPALGTLPLTTDYLQKIALTRDALAKYCTLPWFEKIATGAWVRYYLGSEEGQRIYRICEIKGFSTASQPYKLGDRTTDHLFELKHGDAAKIGQMDNTSNAPWTAYEFKRLVDTCATQRVPMPTRKDVDERFAEMQELITRLVTEIDINDMVTRRYQLVAQGTPVTSIVAERSRLMTQLTLAQRRQDWTEVAAIDAQLTKVEAPTGNAPDDRLARVNERNRKANLEAVRCTEVLEAKHKRRERKNRGKAGASVPELRTGGVSSELTPTVKSFDEAALIDSIEVDLGDF